MKSDLVDLKQPNRMNLAADWIQLKRELINQKASLRNAEEIQKYAKGLGDMEDRSRRPTIH